MGSLIAKSQIISEYRIVEGGKYAKNYVINYSQGQDFNSTLFSLDVPALAPQRGDRNSMMFQVAFRKESGNSTIYSK